MKDVQKDHPDQAIDTPIPSTRINRKAFKALQDAYEGDPEEVDGHTDDYEEGLE